ncbi:MAG: mycothiol system anti-sigma-R factor [Gemmatimonadota bacterium]
MKSMMNMMSCHEAMDRLWEFLDGEMSGEDRQALQRHLEVCGRCYPAYDFQRAYLEYTRRLATREQAPPELRKRLFQRILETDAGETP